MWFRSGFVRCVACHAFIGIKRATTAKANARSGAPHERHPGSVPFALRQAVGEVVVVTLVGDGDVLVQTYAYGCLERTHGDADEVVAALVRTPEQGSAAFRAGSVATFRNARYRRRLSSPRSVSALRSRLVEAK